MKFAPDLYRAAAILVTSAVLASCAHTKPTRNGADLPSPVVLPPMPPVHVALVTDVVAMRDVHRSLDMFDARENSDFADFLTASLANDFADKGYIVVSTVVAGFGVTYSTGSGVALIRQPDGKIEKGLLPVWNGNALSPIQQKALASLSATLRSKNVQLEITGSSFPELLADMMNQVVKSSGVVPVLFAASTVPVSAVQALAGDSVDDVAIFTAEIRRTGPVETAIRSALDLALVSALTIASGGRVVDFPLFEIPAKTSMNLWLIDRKDGAIRAMAFRTHERVGWNLKSDVRCWQRELTSGVRDLNGGEQSLKGRHSSSELGDRMLKSLKGY